MKKYPASEFYDAVNISAPKFWKFVKLIRKANDMPLSNHLPKYIGDL